MCDARPPSHLVSKVQTLFVLIKMADQSETSHELTELHIIYIHYVIWSSLSQTYRVTYKGW